MTTANYKIAGIGDFVRILTGNKNSNSLVYKIEDVKRGVYHLRCLDTGLIVKAHKSRISEIVPEEEMMKETVMDEAAVNETITQDEKTAESTGDNIVTKALEADDSDEQKTAPKKPSEPIKFDFESHKNDGFEIWAKGGLNFDIENVSVQAVCLISPDKTTYETFNLYNGSLGKKGSKGQTFSFSEKNTIEKKRTQLEKRGYTQV